MLGQVSVVSRYAEALGGITLIAIGARILAEHQVLAFLS